MMLTIVRVRPRISAQPNDGGEDELERLCHSVQLISRRDLDGTVTTVMRAMLVQGRREPVGSTDLACKTRLNRVTVIHHLRRLESAGIIERKEHKYVVSIGGFEDFVRRVKEETMRELQEAEVLAQKLDEEYFTPERLPATRAKTVGRKR